ncbi:uncharacterized protein LOC108679572 [Hyalella azteca]|uniref:Uncharacterized protein LOC108679572 n=1 Tax=Hyalella azteca TaxID=294128 RepID=A0A8B7PEI7_HYAAZ|nr:uncharacterized protein LOC108679572 [Hyalella azteca]
MSKISIVLVCGLPASGKTSVCKYLLRSSNNSKIPVRSENTKCENIGSSNNSKIPVTSENTKCENIQTTLTCCNTETESITASSKSFSYIHVCYDRLIPLAEQEKYASLARGLECGKDTEEDSIKCMYLKAARKEVLMKVETLLRILSGDETAALSELEKLVSKWPISLSLSLLFPGSFVILVDDNFYYESMRLEYYSLASKYKTGFCEIVLRCSLNECLQRNALRAMEERVPDEVIERMASKCDFDSYLKTDDLSCVRVVLESTNGSDLSTLEYKIILEKAFWASLNMPVDNSSLLLRHEALVKQAADSRQICSKNIIHRADNILKKNVSQIVNDFKAGAYKCDSGIGVRDVVSVANEVKNTLREELKRQMSALGPDHVEHFMLSLNDSFHRELRRRLLTTS